MRRALNLRFHQCLKWPKPIPPRGPERRLYKGEWQVGIAPRRAVSFYENKAFHLGSNPVPPPCKHAILADKEYVIPRSLFAGHEWATGDRQVVWLCVDCLAEYINRLSAKAGAEHASS